MNHYLTQKIIQELILYKTESFILFSKRIILYFKDIMSDLRCWHFRNLFFCCKLVNRETDYCRKTSIERWDPLNVVCLELVKSYHSQNDKEELPTSQKTEL